jgi:hypothetical protein
MHWLDPDYLPKVSGTFECFLLDPHGPKGETRGVLLKDGKSIRFPPHEAKRLAHVLSADKKVAVRGDGLESALGTVIEARELGSSPDDLQALKHEKPKHPKDEKHRQHS